MSDTYCYLIREKDWDSDSFEPTSGSMPEEMAATMAEHGAFAEAVEKLGARMVGGSALTNAKYGGVVSPGAGERKVEDAVYSDSPYADSSELITGFYLIEVDSLEQARTIAAMVPTENIIEWRKVFPMADDAA
jgi:hypothetical protein